MTQSPGGFEGIARPLKGLIAVRPREPWQLGMFFAVLAALFCDRFLLLQEMSLLDDERRRCLQESEWSFPSARLGESLKDLERGIEPPAPWNPGPGDFPIPGEFEKEPDWLRD